MTLNVHFVGGFVGRNKDARAKMAGQLNDFELLCIASAKRIYPEAKFYFHTAPEYDSSLIPEYVKVVRWHNYDKWPKWDIIRGAHMADKVRLYALQQYGGLYLDTDVICLKRPEWIDRFNGRDITVLSNNKAKSLFSCNSMLYAGEPGATFINAIITMCLESTSSKGYHDRDKWSGLSGYSPSVIAQRPELQPFVRWELRKEMVQGYAEGGHFNWPTIHHDITFPKMLPFADFMHCNEHRRDSYRKPNSLFSTTMAALKSGELFYHAGSGPIPERVTKAAQKLKEAHPGLLTVEDN